MLNKIWDTFILTLILSLLFFFDPGVENVSKPRNQLQQKHSKTTVSVCVCEWRESE